jgi:prepilin-type N-terminal cleavage/methylation domain-containing protein
MARKSRAGFTLVELAIVIIIIGLLIGGVLKGQALITNAQVTTTVAQLKSIEAAVITFKDTYNTIPGDLMNANTKLPNCAVPPCNPAAPNGDGRLALAPGAAPLAGSENQSFFVQLNAAGLLSGITPGTQTFGGNMPVAKISGVGIGAGSPSIPVVAGDFLALVGGTVPPAGLYLVLTGTPTAAPTVSLIPDQALRIDTKLDDGAPDTGLVRAFGVTGAGIGNCGTAAGPGVYATIDGSTTCGLYVKTQN